jgi:hypothetical protein
MGIAFCVERARKNSTGKSQKWEHFLTPASIHERLSLLAHYLSLARIIYE